MRYLIAVIPLMMGLISLGCAQRGLYVHGVQRVCIGDTCYIEAPRDIVEERCSKGKKVWDSGKHFDPSGKKPKACTVLRKSFFHPERRYAMWIWDAKSIPHETCHKIQHIKDGLVFIHENHKKCDGVGLK